MSKSLPDELNGFYACFDAKDTEDLVQAAVGCEASGDKPFYVNEINIKHVLSEVNCMRAAGLDGIAPVFTYMFLQHPNFWKRNYVRMLFIDFSSESEFFIPGGNSFSQYCSNLQKTPTITYTTTEIKIHIHPLPEECVCAHM